MLNKKNGLKKITYFIFLFLGLAVFGYFYCFNFNHRLVARAQTNCNIAAGAQVWVGNDSSWCQGQDVVVGADSIVFITGDHHFKSLTVNRNAYVGDVGITDNFAIQLHGFIDYSSWPRGQMYIPWPEFLFKAKDGIALKYRQVNSDGTYGSWNKVSKWTNDCGSDSCVSQILVPKSQITNTKYEVYVWYIGGAGPASLGLYSLSGTSNYHDWPLVTNDWIKLSLSENCGSSPAGSTGLCADYYAWVDFNAADRNVSFNPSHKVATSAVDSFLDDGSGAFGSGDPFPRTQDFASLNLTVDNNVIVNGGIISVAGGRSGGPYLSQLNRNGQLPAGAINYGSTWLYNGKLSINSTNGNIGLTNLGTVTVEGSTSIGGVVGQYRDGGNGGVIDLNAPNGNISVIGGNIQVDGGQGLNTYSGGGGGGSGGIIKINALTSTGLSTLYAGGGAGGNGGMVHGSGRPGRSEYNRQELNFWNNGAPLDCWLNGNNCDGYNTIVVASNNCSSQVGAQSNCGQRPGLAGIGGGNGSTAGGGGEGNCAAETQGGGGGGGTGGIIVTNIATGTPTVEIYASGGAGGQGSNNGSLPGGGPVRNFNLPTAINFNNIQYLSAFALSGQCGAFGSGNGAAPGGGGAGGVVNAVNIPRPPTVDLTANPTTITPGQSSMLNWTITNISNPAEDCQATSVDSTWNGKTIASSIGSFSVSPSVSTTYALTCTNHAGQTATDYAIVNVNGSLAVSLSAQPSSGPDPLNGVKLTARIVSTTGTGSFNYSFYCKTTDTMTVEPTATTSNTTLTTTTPCSYSPVGTYSAKVIVTQGSLLGTATTPITVNASTLTASLGANPSSGMPPVNSTLTATAGGTDTGPYKYEFYCNQNDALPTETFENITNKVQSTANRCAYTITTTAKVVITSPTNTAPATTTITINPALSWGDIYFRTQALNGIFTKGLALLGGGGTSLGSLATLRNYAIVDKTQSDKDKFKNELNGIVNYLIKEQPNKVKIYSASSLALGSITQSQLYIVNSGIDVTVSGSNGFPVAIINLGGNINFASGGIFNGVAIAVPNPGGGVINFEGPLTIKGSLVADTFSPTDLSGLVLLPYNKTNYLTNLPGLAPILSKIYSFYAL